jgi:L-amino acid N-acyltransferase YncA
MILRRVELRDAKKLSEIYNYYIQHTIITFELFEIDHGEIEKRIMKIMNLNHELGDSRKRNTGAAAVEDGGAAVEDGGAAVEDGAAAVEDGAAAVEDGDDDMLYPFFVLEDHVNNDSSLLSIVGYAYAAKFRERAAYDQTAELSIYLDKDHLGKGYGVILYNAVINHLTKKGFKVAMAGISSPNPASFRFHEKLGFKKVALLESVGYKFEQYIDVAFYQKILN